MKQNRRGNIIIRKKLCGKNIVVIAKDRGNTTLDTANTKTNVQRNMQNLIVKTKHISENIATRGRANYGIGCNFNFKKTCEFKHDTKYHTDNNVEKSELLSQTKSLNLEIKNLKHIMKKIEGTC